jgi:5-methyltetrahydrofolate--homocysteine methyltransferase
MIVIAERINATRSRIARAMEERDAKHIARETRRQAEAGATYIDVNAGSSPARELESLKWAVDIVQKNTDLPLCIDSPNPDVLRAGLELIEGDRVMLNSVTAEAEKMEQVFPIAAEAGAMLVALAMDDSGLPQTADQRVDIAGKLVETAASHGITADRLLVDPCIQPLSTSPDQAMEALSAVFRIMQWFEGIHTTCGLSNISFGLPRRALVNSTYMACLIMAGLDSAIIDPLAPGMMDAVRAGEALAGRDEYCMAYIQAMREAQK